MKIPIKESINSSAWLECTAKDEYAEDATPFRIRLKSFQRVNVESLKALLSKQDNDAGKELEKILGRDDGVLWFVGLEIVSLGKRKLDTYDLNEHVLVTDHEDFEFNVLDLSDALWRVEEGVHQAIDKLLRFSSGGADLKPKIKTEGVLPFMLPTDDPDDYFVSCTGGDIKEI